MAVVTQFKQFDHGQRSRRSRASSSRHCEKKLETSPLSAAMAAAAHPKNHRGEEDGRKEGRKEGWKRREEGGRSESLITLSANVKKLICRWSERRTGNEHS